MADREQDEAPTWARRPVGRRGLLAAGVSLVGAGVLGWELAPASLTERVRSRVGLGPDVFIPDAAEGVVRLERVRSESMGELDLFTAVPAGLGDGAGLPVVVVLHGASAAASQLRGFGLGRFVTAAVESGTPPFVLMGADDGPAGWIAGGGADPSLMLREELPRWLAERGYAADRRALWDWSRGGYGALRFVAGAPDWAAALALFSPALRPDDPVLRDLEALRELPWGLWCGDRDPFRDGAVALADAAPVAPDPWVGGDGGHTRAYWNGHTLAMLDGLARRL